MVVSGLEHSGVNIQSLNCFVLHHPAQGCKREVSKFCVPFVCVNPGNPGNYVRTETPYIKRDLMVIANTHGGTTSGWDSVYKDVTGIGIGEKHALLLNRKLNALQHCCQR